jgi:hypothetical protein
MPKPLSRKRAAQTNEYESDDGFVEDAPTSKKQRSDNKPKGGKVASSAEMGKDKDGNEYWEVGSPD